jgi:PmbA protein
MNGSEILTDGDLVDAAVEEARKAGADAAEAYLDRSRELSIEVRNQKVENLKVAEETGIGIRVLRGGAMGFAFTAELGRLSVTEAVQAALANARVSAEDRYNMLPEPPKAYPEEAPVDQMIDSTPLVDKIALAKQIEASGRAYDSRVSLTEQAGYEDVAYKISIANSRGVHAVKTGSFCGGVAAFVAGGGDDQQTGVGLQFSLHYADLDAEAVGLEGAMKAVRMLGARRAPTSKAVVVIDPYVVTSFLGLISSALTADAVQKGRSLFAGKVSQDVAAPGVTVIDDGRLPGGLASAPFDGEGYPSQCTVLIEDGCLQGFIYNSYTAARDQVSSTGNASRSTFESPPELGSTNFYLAPGTKSPEQIIKETARGLYLTEIMGMHMANPISGDFSLGAAGILIENGEFTKPVRGMVIAGNILNLLKGVDAVGQDLRFFGGKGAPTIRVSGLTVSGE